MLRAILLLVAIAMLATTADAHEPFQLLSSDARTITADALADAERRQTQGTIVGSQIAFNGTDIRLVVTTGPEDDMLSYRIQGLRNPTLVIPSGATLRILFVNSDSDMRHDVRFAHMKPPFEITPKIEASAGSNRLSARSDSDVLQAEEIVLKARSNGEYVYYCSVRGHARGGMWGNIAVGVTPTVASTDTMKTIHGHQAGDDHAQTAPTPTPTPTPSAHGHHGHSPEPSPTATPTASPTPSVHDGHAMPAATPSPAEHDHQRSPLPDVSGHRAHASTEMSSTIDIGDPMNREGSGTSWLPDTSPMHAYMKMFKDGGMFMFMGTGFVRYTQVGSDRDISVGGKGDRNRFDAPTMFMAMYSRPLSDRAQLGLRVMASLDPAIERGYGYPLLYQSGELYRGEPIHDRQHPHDFISELAASLSFKVNKKHSAFVYGGIAGEPALGPPMYLHRASGMNNPDAPIGHHWQDASHITWGVITGGYNFGKVKIEGSVFNGTEPDEDRWRFDTLRLNSFSGRISVNPTKELALQVSHGYLKKPERAEPDLEHLHRTTASAIYNKVFGEDRNWASTFVWGQNYKEGHATNSFLFESDYTFGKNAIFGRIERVQKDGHELVIPHEDPLHEEVFWVGAYSLGYVRDVVKDKGMDVGIGGMATFNSNPSALTPYYGGTRHAGWQVFLRFRPSRSKH